MAMLEPELFALLEHTADAAYTVAEDGTICSWNAAAERLFGHQASEVLHRHIEEVLDAYDRLGTEPLAGGSEVAVRHWDNAGGGIPNFDLDVRTGFGNRIWNRLQHDCKCSGIFKCERIENQFLRRFFIARLSSQSARRCTCCGVSPTCPMTGRPAAVSLRTVSATGRPPSNFTAAAPPSWKSRAAFRMACSAEI